MSEVSKSSRLRRVLGPAWWALLVLGCLLVDFYRFRTGLWEVKAQAFFPAPTTPFYLSVPMLPWVYTSASAVPPQRNALSTDYTLENTTFFLSLLFPDLPSSMSCLLRFAYYEQGSVPHAFPVLPSACPGSVKDENESRKIKKIWRDIPAEQGKQLPFTFLGEMRTQELRAYLCRFCCSWWHLCCSCSCCWAAASRNSSAFLFSSLNICLIVWKEVSARHFLLLPHPASYIAAAASWLRRKSPSMRLEEPSGPPRAHSRCLTSSSFTFISFSTERKSNKKVRAGWCSWEPPFWPWPHLPWAAAPCCCPKHTSPLSDVQASGVGGHKQEDMSRSPGSPELQRSLSTSHHFSSQ